jgi:aryl sulfotransferase
MDADDLRAAGVPDCGSARSLAELSPWLDISRDEVQARLSAQRHRRFIKTHTPLDGIPLTGA